LRFLSFFSGAIATGQYAIIFEKVKGLYEAVRKDIFFPAYATPSLAVS
jgi:hypothetical protein